MIIPKERILHMHGVAEWMYEHAEEYGCEDKDKMYFLGLMHDIGYIYGKENHEQNGAELIGINTYYGDIIQAHGLTPQEYIDAKDILESEIPNEMILLWAADMMVDMSGKPVGFATRLKNIGNKYGYNSEPYRICSETISWLKSREKYKEDS